MFIYRGAILFESKYSDTWFIFICRYVCLWPSKIGYSLREVPSAICGFLDFDDVECAIPHSKIADNFQSDCDFIVQVKGIELSISANQTQTLVQCPKNSSSPVRKSSLAELFKHSRGSSKSRSVPNQSQPYYLRATSILQRDPWVRDINRTLATYRLDQEKNLRDQASFLLRNQKKIRSVYNSFTFQSGTAVLVGLNFIVLIFQSQLGQNNISGNSTQEISFSMLETIFTTLFTIELVINALSFWRRAFLVEPWNW